VPVEQHRSEVPERRIDVLETHPPDVTDAATTCDLYRSGRRVDADHRATSRLKLERHAPGATPDVQDPAADPAETAPLRHGPPPHGREVGLVERIDEPVITLDD